MSRAPERLRVRPPEPGLRPRLDGGAPNPVRSFTPLDDGRARIIMQVGIALCVVVNIAYLALGQYNDDEGWYLYASRAVMHGLLPYRDVAYTQMPLLPYIYGVLQVIGPGLFIGRLTSVVLSIGTLGMSVLVARRYGGARAGAITAVLLAAFTFGTYFDAIVKTYSLVAFFFAATLFVLTSDMDDGVRYPLALLFALAAAMVRLTAVFFVIPVLLFALRAAPRRARLLLMAESALALLAAAWFILPNWASASWYLIGSHTGHWGDASLFDQGKQIVTTRLPDIALNYGPVLVLCGACLMFLRSPGRRLHWRRNPAPLAAVALGLVLFAASHLANGLWIVEYLAPAEVVLIPLLGIALARYFAETDHSARSFLIGALALVVVLLPVGESTLHVDVSGGRMPLQEIDRVAAFVNRNTAPDDNVLVFEALGIVIDAHREPMPGMTLAQFSLQDVDTATAQKLHVVNYQIVADAIRNKATRVLLITDYDWQSLTGMNSQDADSLYRAVNQNYSQALIVPQFGQFQHTLYVYLAR